MEIKIMVLLLVIVFFIGVSVKVLKHFFDKE
jgi:hypothetical protein